MGLFADNQHTGYRASSNALFSPVTNEKQMKEDTRWKLIIATGLILLSLVLFTAHYLIFHDEHHLSIFFLGDLAFIPIEVLIVTLIIDQILESREKQRKMEKLNMVIGTFFSTFGTPLLARLTGTDDSIGTVKQRLAVTANWDTARFEDMRKCLEGYSCSVSLARIDLEDFRRFLIDHEELLLRLVENPMVFEHESFTDLLLALSHLTEELKARGDLSALPPSDKSHLSADIQRVYSQLIVEWIKYMEYLKLHYPYLFSLALRKNPFDESASVIVMQDA